MKRHPRVRRPLLAPAGVGSGHLGGAGDSAAEMFLSPGGSGGRVEMERHGEQQSIRSSRIESGKQAAAGQFVPLGRGEGMRSINTMQSLIRNVLRSAVCQLASDDMEFVLLGRSEGMFRSEQAGESPSVQSGLEALASCGFPVEKRDSGKFVFLGLGEGNLGDDAACRGFCVERPFSSTR